MLIDHSHLEKKQIKTAEQVVEVLKSIRLNLEPFEYDKEYLYVIGLTRRNTIKYVDLAGIGTLAGCLVGVHEVFRIAIHRAAGNILLAHNHPSGNFNPSDADIKLTKKIRASGKILNIELIDHIIFSDEGFYSFANEGYL